MAKAASGRLRRWISYAACGWVALFAAPHAWWALGFTAGFPGGAASYQAFMSSRWRYLYNLEVIVLGGVAVVVTLQLLRSNNEARRRVLRTVVWIASGALTLRGVAGLVVDRASDPIWWPTFLVGGVLFGGVAWLARAPGRKAPAGDIR